MQFNENILAGLSDQRGTNSTLVKLLDKHVRAKKNITALVVDRSASEKGCYCAQNGPSNHAAHWGIVKLSLFDKINDIQLKITFLLRHELLLSHSSFAYDPCVVPPLPLPRPQHRGAFYQLLNPLCAAASKLADVSSASTSAVSRTVPLSASASSPANSAKWSSFMQHRHRF